MVRRTVAAVAVAALAAGTVPGVAAAGDRLPRLDWRPCPTDRELLCAAVPVPLDHADPRGPKITLRATKRPADDPRHKIGTLFVDNGGPGGSAADFTLDVASAFGARVRARYDIVGVDPRGIAGEKNCVTEGCGSAPVRCAAQPGDPAPPATPEEAFPVGAEQTRARLAYDDHVRALCAERGDPILAHMSTADTVRDLELMRRAVGDDKLNFYGVSYGSYMGATYAAMYPDRVRSIIVDGVLDPVAWSTGEGAERGYLFTGRIGSGDGTREAITSALAECDRAGKAKCPAAGSVRAKYDAVMARLKRGPLELPAETVTYQSAVQLLADLSKTREAYPRIMELVDYVYRAMRAVEKGTPVPPPPPWTQEQPPSPTGSGPTTDPITNLPYLGVACSDSANPRDRGAVQRTAAWAERTAPGYGALWTWDGSACRDWPITNQAAFRGPWQVWTAAPILVVGNTHDPATPISGAKALNRLMPNSRLLTVDTYGHGALGEPCALQAYDRYLIDRALPTATCKTGPLFG
ncbi:alpha/beta hydrolase [Actinokineospora auranticolor]|uniref:Alpha/beta hydrolase family protein n=1 Tax=Actinokineospora auranticolor TaxID=155976 RepID=A0A2S6GJH6_9PSEU|nr:alpha/beta hydrolase [Actinokineospora auranticolor]PPK65388.1 alpha/beta hydrolase family protein [Actinokineospora auranticolor]